jgi:hypothetical protein
MSVGPLGVQQVLVERLHPFSLGQK